MGAEQPIGGGGPASLDSLLGGLGGAPAGAEAQPGSPGGVLSLASQLGGA
jgi:hypothetical protein